MNITVPDTNDVTTSDQTRSLPVTSTEPIERLLETASLYLHIPFCHTRCYYCDFNTYAGMLPLREPYVRALLTEIELAGKMAQLADGSPRRSRTVFFGGGTPSLLSVAQINRLLQACFTSFAVDAEAEITMEANPGTLTQEQLVGLRSAGVNRLSMGAQSFDAALLNALGRIHTPDEITQAVTYARAAGFTSINLDFMFGLPQQTMQHWRDTLKRALDLRPEHFSLYSLIIEEGTPFYTWAHEGRITPGDEDLCADMYEYADELLQQAGYLNYEISNWALPGHHSRHNLTYWQNLPYFGLGAEPIRTSVDAASRTNAIPSSMARSSKLSASPKWKARSWSAHRRCPRPPSWPCALLWGCISQPLSSASLCHLPNLWATVCVSSKKRDC